MTQSYSTVWLATDTTLHLGFELSQHVCKGARFIVENTTMTTPIIQCPETLNPKPSTQNREPKTLHSNPSTLNPMLRTHPQECCVCGA